MLTLQIHSSRASYSFESIVPSDVNFVFIEVVSIARSTIDAGLVLGDVGVLIAPSPVQLRHQRRTMVSSVQVFGQKHRCMAWGVQRG
jgi:hypothetical protein